MRYVILRDDDTNALTPPEWLDRLYRPFLDRGLPVNLATIPQVHTTVTRPDGRLEGFLITKEIRTPPALTLDSNRALVNYLRSHPGYHLVQHGFHHDYFEFDRHDRLEIMRRLEQGTKLLMDAGFSRPRTFVAPYDKLSSSSLAQVAKRFGVLSTGWFELRRLPPSWWPLYALKKMLKRPHWQVGSTLLLTHAGCLLSCHRPYNTMLDSIKRRVESGRLTVLVTHWWEYFRNRRPDQAFIAILHQTAEYFARQPDLKVIAFDDLLDHGVPVN